MTQSKQSAKVSASDLPTRLDENGEPVWDYFDADGNGHNYTDAQAKSASQFSVTELRGITSFEEARRIARETYGEEIDATTEIGAGFIILNGKDKDRLLGIDFIILEMSFYEGKHGPFVAFLAVTEDNHKYIVNDSGAGIFTQLDEFFVRTNRRGGLFVHGLRKSDYDEHVNSRGEEIPAGTTYYLNV